MSLKEVEKSIKQLIDILKESNSERENNQQSVPLEVKIDDSETEDIESYINLFEIVVISLFL